LNQGAYRNAAVRNLNSAESGSRTAPKPDRDI